MVKILFIVTKSVLGGAQRYVHDIVLNLPKDKFEAEVALGGNGPLAQKLSGEGIKVFSFAFLQRDVNLLYDIGAFFDLLRLIVKEKPDIVHLNSSKAGALGSLAARLAEIFALRKIKIVFTAHGWAWNNNYSIFSKSVIKILYFIIAVISDAAIAVSEAVRKEAVWMPFVQKKFFVIHHGLPEIHYLERKEARSRLSRVIQTDIQANTLLIGSLSELHPIKGLNYAIEAISLLRKKFPFVKYIIFGEGELKDELSCQIKHLNLEDAVFLAGYIEDARIYIKAFDVYLHPSLSEALGYAVIEAAMAGVPIVATHAGGIPEVVGTDNTTGILVPPRDPGSIKNALNAILADDAARKKMGEAAKERVKKEFGFNRMIFETEALYERILKTK